MRRLRLSVTKLHAAREHREPRDELAFIFVLVAGARMIGAQWRRPRSGVGEPCVQGQHRDLEGKSDEAPDPHHVGAMAEDVENEEDEGDEASRTCDVQAVHRETSRLLM
jgi:hypothetical protein